PFLDQMLYTCLLTVVVILMVSLVTADTDEDAKAISLPKEIFKTGINFNIAAYIVMVILAVIYTVFW
ncbi:MAG TPA: sodium/glucose cotransporter, partial [Bacteroidales bacterium]|nr:sodium/glucose cotransporter [Bacteroidales bacterium]